MQIGVTGGFRLSKTDAVQVYRVFEEIRQQHGGTLVDKDIVDHARSPSSELHKYFTWDADKALEKNLLREAAELRRGVKYIIIDSPREPKPKGNFYVTITDEESASKVRVPITSVLDDNTMKMQVLTEARDKLIQWRRRFENLVELMNARGRVQLIIDEIETLIQPTPPPGGASPPRRRRRGGGAAQR